MVALAEHAAERQEQTLALTRSLQDLLASQTRLLTTLAPAPQHGARRAERTLARRTEAACPRTFVLLPVREESWRAKLSLSSEFRLLVA